jgi:hypothetical protein
MMAILSILTLIISRLNGIEELGDASCVKICSLLEIVRNPCYEGNVPQSNTFDANNEIIET